MKSAWAWRGQLDSAYAAAFGAGAALREQAAGGRAK